MGQEPGYTVTVYRFSYFDRNSAVQRVAEDYATLEAISEMGGQPLLESAQVVAASRVSFAGLLRNEESKQEK